MESLNIDEIPFVEKPIDIPSFEELQTVLSNGLKTNFTEVNVEIIESPDFTQSPFYLAASGICGSPTLIEIGGPPYLLPLVDRTKLYDLPSICRKSLPNRTELLAIGAGAGPFPLAGTNCEGMINLKINEDNTVISESHYSKVVQPNEECHLAKIPNSETRCALLSNLLVSEGKPGKVLRVNCKKRCGSEDFITSIRSCLTKSFSDKTIGLGGVFLLKNGKAKQHVMRDFSKTPLLSDEDVNNWLKFYEMPAPLIALGVLITNEADLDLRLQHFHSFSKHGWGGHYHYDTTPDIVEYDGYFNVCERVVRVDQPVATHKYGRD